MLRMAGLSPIISRVLLTLRFSTLFSMAILFLSMALRKVINKRFKSGGLEMKS